jgi:cytochrome c
MRNAAALRAVGYTKDTPEPVSGTIERDPQDNPTGTLIAKPNAMILYKPETAARIPAQICVGCHGVMGEGGLGPILIGNHPIKGIDETTLVLAGYWPYAPTLFDYIRRAMPWQQPNSLTNDEVYALSAFILAENGLIPKDKVIDASSLPKVRMPNRNGFIVRFPKLTPTFNVP